jgi:acetolactate synthase-1/2/3 large subunit
VESKAAIDRLASDVVAARLAREGTRALFGVPGGGGNLELIEAAGQHGLPFVLTATESAAAVAAIAHAEVTGAIGACLTTLGPGAASAVNGVACAHLDRAPILVFTDAQGATSAGTVFEHQQLDQPALFAPITNWTTRLTSASAPATLDLAIAKAWNPRPGPVHIDCVADTDSADTAARASEPPPARSGNSHHADRDRVDAILAAARRPIVLAGLGARRPADAEAVRNLIERHRLPALVTYKAKGVVPDQHRCFGGVFTHATLEKALIDQSDLILGIGLDPVELLPRPWTYAQPVLYIGAWSVSSAHVPFAAQLVGDVATTVADVSARLATSQWDLDDLRRSVERQRRVIDIPTGGLSAQRVVAIAAERFAARCRVTVDAGAHMFAATMLWPAAAPGQLLISNGLSTMGFALPAAIGAAVADGGRRVVALTGDGGLLMCAGELLTAARERLPIVVVVFNDASLSLIEIKQQRKQYRPAGVELGAVNWRAIAEGFGVTAFAAANGREFERALEQATAVDGPSLIDARIDRHNYGEVLTAIRGR